MAALRDLQPKDYALTRLPVKYDPHATADEWLSFVEEWAEEGRMDALREYVGYRLHIGAIPIHRALLPVGSSANGNGTLLHMVRALLACGAGREHLAAIGRDESGRSVDVGTEQAVDGGRVDPRGDRDAALFDE